MKRIIAILTVCVGFSTYSTGQNRTVQDATKDVVISMIPDSVEIQTKTDTAFFLGTDDPSALFFTENKQLYLKIVKYLNKNIGLKDSVYFVKLKGTKIDPFSRFYRREFPLFGDLYTKKARQINGFGIYRVLNYMPAGVSKEEFSALQNQQVSSPDTNQNKKSIQQQPAPYSGYKSDWN